MAGTLREAPPAARVQLWRRGVWGLAALAVTAVVVRLAGANGHAAWFTNFLLLFSSLLVQAFPFILIGALASAAIEVFISPRALARVARLPGPLQLPAAGMAGMAFPVCECGSVPVGRRLAAKGLSPGAAITFTLAAPIVNPIVLVSTAVAFRARGNVLLMVLGRFGLGLATAVAVGWVMSSRTSAELLRPRSEDELAEEEDDPHRSRRAAFFSHFATDTVFMGRYLIFGAAVAAAIQTFAPPSFLSKLAGVPVLDLLAMMALAGILSLCSESDAFVAASFVQFGPAAQLAFLAFGPMFNMKLGALYAGTFSKGFARTVLAVVAASVLVGTLWIEVFVR